MNVLLVAHSPAQTKSDYLRLQDAIRSSGTKWWHYLDSVWFIATDKTVEQVGRELPKIYDGLVLVIEVARPAQGMLPEEAWGWINDNVPYRVPAGLIQSGDDRARQET